MSLEEIARTLDMSLGTVKSSLHRALSRMRGALAGGRA
jgi:DNA-directed RNA polymerase specialized sigma24 family protein